MGQLLGLFSYSYRGVFIFLLAIPVMLAAASLDLYKHHESFSSEQFGLFISWIQYRFLSLWLQLRRFSAIYKTFVCCLWNISYSPWRLYFSLLCILYSSILPIVIKYAPRTTVCLQSCILSYCIGEMPLYTRWKKLIVKLGRFKYCVAIYCWWFCLNRA